MTTMGGLTPAGGNRYASEHLGRLDFADLSTFPYQKFTAGTCILLQDTSRISFHWFEAQLDLRNGRRRIRDYSKLRRAIILPYR